MLEEIFSLLDEGRSSFNAADWLQNKLKAAGFQYLDEGYSTNNIYRTQALTLKKTCP